MDAEKPKKQVPERLIRKLRASARRLVRVLRVMHDGDVEGVDCTPVQCHVLIELSERGRLTTGELAELLEVDKSTASRTLRPMIDKGLVEALADPKDQRTKPIRLTDSGREGLRKVHAFGDHQVHSALALLNEEERAAVLRGVSLYEQALHRAKVLADIHLRPVEARDEMELADLLRGVMEEFDAMERPYAAGDTELGAMHQAFEGQGHAYFVAERGGRLIAGGGIAPLGGGEADVCELRKLHVMRAARGVGLGRQILDRCLSAARNAKYQRCYLGTLRHMHRARTLCEGAGFAALERPMGGPKDPAPDRWHLIDL